MNPQPWSWSLTSVGLITAPSLAPVVLHRRVAAAQGSGVGKPTARPWPRRPGYPPSVLRIHRPRLCRSSRAATVARFLSHHNVDPCMLWSDVGDRRVRLDRMADSAERSELGGRQLGRCEEDYRRRRRQGQPEDGWHRHAVHRRHPVWAPGQIAQGSNAVTCSAR